MKRLTNLVEETLECINENGKTCADVLWVGIDDEGDESKCMWCTWEEFATRWSPFIYDNGYGSAEVDGRLVVVGEDWWLERAEYDGSEWWEFRTLPTKPAVHKVPGRLR